MESVEYEWKNFGGKGMNWEKILRMSILDHMTLDEIINKFEKMCDIDLELEDPEDDVRLFETGTYDFSGEELFCFSLIRQFPNEEGEFCQLHMDILYFSDDANRGLSESAWSFDIDTDFFSYVRNSKAYMAVKDHHMVKIDIYMDET